jgi:ZIP family zinc transporter/zinc and cadmium transporter
VSVLLLVAAVAAANVAGALLVTAGAAGRRSLLGFLVGFGAGFMLAVALLEMLPPAAEAAHGMTAVLLGYMGVHLAQHTVVPHFHFGEETHADAMVSPAVGLLAVAGMVPHAFFDGVAIASGHARAEELGVVIALAVLLHKVPAGSALASIMLASGNTRGRTLAAVTGVAAATVLGALVTPASVLLERYGLALAAGVTLYVAASNLIPETQHQRGWLLPAGVFVGVAAFYVTRALIPIG